VKHIGIHYLNARKVGYIPLVKKVNFTKGFYENHSDAKFKIVIPLVKVLEENSNEAVIALSTDGNSQALKLQILDKKGK
jgi:hypothetical protein